MERKSTFAKRQLKRGNPKKEVNQFHPAQPSPNLFCNRLELRMKAYYENLKSSFKL